MYSDFNHKRVNLSKQWIISLYNVMGMKKFNHMLKIDILRNSSRKIFGCPDLRNAF